MANKLSGLLIGMMLVSGSIANATDNVNTKDMARAIEIIILDLKKQKDESGDRKAQIDGLNEKMAEMKKTIDVLSLENANLKIESMSTTQKVTKLDETTSALVSASKARRFAVESMPVMDMPQNQINENIYVVNAQSLHVRKEPDPSSGSNGYLSGGDLIKVSEQRNGFSKMKLGWVSTKYLKKAGDIK